MKPQVICVPGSVAPAEHRYRPLLGAVGDRADLHLKELEVYRGDTPAEDYGIEEELTAIDRLADSLRLDRFHLVGYSGGGFVSHAGAKRGPQHAAFFRRGAFAEPPDPHGRRSGASHGA